MRVQIWPCWAGAWDLLQGLAHHSNERGSDSVLCVHVDLLSEESTQQAKKKVEAVFDGADILVHSAGMIMQGHVATALLNDFNLQHRCNVMAPLLLTQLFLPSLIKTHGHIVFINSTAGLVSSAGLSQYSATKHALKALADSLREEVNPHGVRVLSVYLGRHCDPDASQHSPDRGQVLPARAVDSTRSGCHGRISDMLKF
jgi:NAD(P)-dependent dehydrogenase (short-subunit alcohol dehydrogenase family)